MGTTVNSSQQSVSVYQQGSGQLKEALYIIDITEINRVLIDEFIPVG
jgi:hypothetical protein